MKTLFSYLLILLIIAPASLQAADKQRPAKPGFENKQLRVRLIPRSPEQIAAFYEARKFPPAMISRLEQACFITVGIQNRSPDILWLDLQHWQFISDGKIVKRYHRDEWKHTWKNLSVPMASQSTFRWTLLPELLDFRPGEREGGNVILERQPRPFSLKARFETGKDKSGKPVDIVIDNIQCAGGKS